MEEEREDRDEKLYEVLGVCYGSIDDQITFLKKESCDIFKEVTQLLSTPSMDREADVRFQSLKIQIVAISINIHFLKKLKASFDSFYEREY